MNWAMVPAVSLADNQEHQETTTAASASDISNTNGSTNPKIAMHNSGLEPHRQERWITPQLHFLS
jgi:hypothetical protein